MRLRVPIEPALVTEPEPVMVGVMAVFEMNAEKSIVRREAHGHARESAMREPSPVLDQRPAISGCSFMYATASRNVLQRMSGSPHTRRISRPIGRWKPPCPLIRNGARPP